MRPFAYERSRDAQGAIALVAEASEAKFLGGGTNLVDLMRLGVETPSLLVDVTRLPLGGIQETEQGGLRIGAGVSNSDLAAHPLVLARYPLLASAVLHGASGQLRNLATTGGNLLQRTRCDYFQDVTKPCNKREPGSGCPAREGHHRNLAILGWSEHCVATHPSDMAVALAALDAVVHVEGASGARAVPIGEFHRLPGDAPERDTVLEHGELIVAVEIPRLEFARSSRYVKVRERASFAFAVASLAAALDVEEGHVRGVRHALGGVAHKPWRALRAEQAMLGAPATEETFARAADAELAPARPLRDNAYKMPLARNLIVSVLAEIARAS
ncbi:MAG: xanthine dehydrogenase YagS FAD-binding subunit [Gaiellales bacterium]|nr:xanthine dehydrogenase YagS FAD-binding subunit [Gaiellales bacterium]